MQTHKQTHRQTIFFYMTLLTVEGILTIKNVKYSHRLTTGRRRDVQLIRILFIQVFILVLFAIPVTIQKIYASLTMFMFKNSLTLAIDSLVNQISIEISYISNSTTFYIYSFTNKNYRREVYHLLSSLFKHHRGIHQNSIQPIDGSRLNPNETIVRTDIKLNKLNIRNRNE